MTSPNANLSSGYSQSNHSSGNITPLSNEIGGGNSQRSRVSTGFSSQQSTLVGVSPARKHSALQAAVLSFKNKLSPQQLADFKDTTYDVLRDQILSIQRDQENNRKIMNLSRVQSCLEAMRQFGQVIEVFLNVSNVIAFIWGPMKFLLLVSSTLEVSENVSNTNVSKTASNLSDSFETLLDAYERIGEQLPLLQEYEALFWDNPHMIDVLEMMYMDILEFHQDALKFFSGKCEFLLEQVSRTAKIFAIVWRNFFRSMWKNFSTKFDGILNKLRRHKDLVECRATISYYQRYKEDMKSLQEKTQELIAKEDAKNMRSVKEWLAVGYVLKSILCFNACL